MLLHGKVRFIKALTCLLRPFQTRGIDAESVHDTGSYSFPVLVCPTVLRPNFYALLIPISGMFTNPHQKKCVSYIGKLKSLVSTVLICRDEDPDWFAPLRDEVECSFTFSRVLSGRASLLNSCREIIWPADERPGRINSPNRESSIWLSLYTPWFPILYHAKVNLLLIQRSYFYYGCTPFHRSKTNLKEHPSVLVFA